MNYRHIYHAGNFADVFKHIVLVMVLDYLRQKDKPFFVLDTHAGLGLYDLSSVEARKTGEAEAGIGRLWTRADAPPAVANYLAIIRQLNSRHGGKYRLYPGSPLIARALLRDDDRLCVSELHPEDYKTLVGNLNNDRRVTASEGDGYTAIRALLPPHERRGLVLVDPPFEARDEFAQMVRALKDGIKRWANGVYMFWYPVKDMAQIEEYHAALKATGIPDIMAAHFMLRPPDDPAALNGCGLAIVNPPWTLAAALATIGPWLAAALADNGAASYETIQIAGEAG